MISVRQIMTPRSDLITLSPTARLGDAGRVMAENRIRHIPVVAENGRLVGMVSQRDVLRAGGPGKEASAPPFSRPLADVMSTPVHTVDPEAGVRQTALRLQSLKIGCLAVTRGEALEGIVTDSDFVGVAINLLEQLEAVEPLEKE
jgi:CBS domain-containing membrane protein